MIAAVLRETGKPLELIDDLVSEPLRAGQVKVKILYSGLCRSQLMEIDGLRGDDNYLPHLLGHEGVGMILEVGKSVTKVKPNDIVILTWIKGQGLSESGTIYKSKIGKINSGPIVTLCTQANISEDRVFKINSNIPLTVAAILGCAVATGAGMAIKFNENIQNGVILINGLGGIGINTLLMAKIFNPKMLIVSDIDHKKLLTAEKIGCDFLIDSSESNLLDQIKIITKDAGVDMAFESSGTIGGINETFESLNERGTLVFASHPKYGEYLKIDPFDLIKGKKIFGSWGGGVPFEMILDEVLKYYLQKRLNLDILTTEIFSLSEINYAIELMRSGEVLRPIISMK